MEGVVTNVNVVGIIAWHTSSLESFLDMRAVNKTWMRACNNCNYWWWQWLKHYGKREKKSRTTHLNLDLCTGVKRVFTGGTPHGVLVICNNPRHFRHPVILQTVPLFKQVLNQIVKRKGKSLKKKFNTSVRNVNNFEQMLRIERNKVKKLTSENLLCQRIDEYTRSDRRKKHKIDFNISKLDEQ